MEQIKRILHHHFGRTTWEIARSKEGQQNAGYRARNGGGEVFVKVTDAVAALQRLGEIAVAPGVLASGSDQGRTYVIQEYITGNYPDGQWVATHLPILASCIRRYHDDQPLTALLSQSAVTRYHERVALDLAQLEAPLPSGRQRTSMNVALSSTIFWQRWQKRAIPMLVFHHDERRDESHTGPLTSENVRGIWKSGVHWQAARYEKECQDDMYSKSGDQSGSCSHHGGNLRPLYGH